MKLLFGIIFAAFAGLLWGLVFIVPLLLPEYPASLLSVSRYLAFGLVCVPLAFLSFATLRKLRKADWLAALKLSIIGNFLYYGFLAFAIQRIGNPLPAVIIGTLPVVIAVCANLGVAQSAAHRALPWRRLIPPLLLIAFGIGCVNIEELAYLKNLSGVDYALGIGASLIAVACWTWYPLHNDRWLKDNPSVSAAAWSTVQGLVTLLPALVGFALLSYLLDGKGFTAPFGEKAGLFLGLMFALGFAASWLGTLFWNAASQRVPPALSVQLIVFETVFALLYGYLHRGQAPSFLSLIGITFLVIGVGFGVNTFRKTSATA